MKLSENTVNILKNFSNINQNILVKSGNKLRTMSTMKNILGEASIAEEFPKEFGIYDLNEFLGVLSLVKDSNLEFGESYLTVNGGRTKVRYFYSDSSILTIPPETFNAPECDVSFTIPGSVLANVLKASAVIQLPDIVFEFNFKADNLKMIPGNYQVTASTEAGVSNWRGAEVSYWIAMEAKSE